MTADHVMAADGWQLRPIKTLGLVCIGTALLASVALGVWELAHPVFGGAGRYTLTPASSLQLWGYGILQALKPVGFVAGLAGVYLAATRHTLLLKTTLGLAVAGGLWYAAVWIMIAATGRDDAIYIVGRPVGSDAHTNGGMLFLWFAPIVLGVAALLARRIPPWQATWLIGTGVLGSFLFGFFPAGVALLLEGILWLTVGAIVYTAERGA